MNITKDTSKNTREQLSAAAEWLDEQDDRLAFGLRSAFDGLRLYEYWTTQETLPEHCDQDDQEPDIDLSEHRILALGYDPLTSAFTHDAPIGALAATVTLQSTFNLIDSVEFVSQEGDSDDIRFNILSVLGKL